MLQFLQQAALFAGLPEALLNAEILPHCHSQEISKGEYVIVPQQQVDRLSILCSGRLHVFHIFSDGNYSLMSVLEPGDMLGPDLICTRTQQAPYHVMAAEPARLLSFPASLLLQPGPVKEPHRLELLRRLLTLISNENMKKDYRLAILSQKGLRERVLTYLELQANKRQTRSFEIPFSREELASYLCVNRSALSHELSLMQQEGLITFRKNQFTLLAAQLHIP